MTIDSALRVKISIEQANGAVLENVDPVGPDSRSVFSSGSLNTNYTITYPYSENLLSYGPALTPNYVITCVLNQMMCQESCPIFLTLSLISVIISVL